MKARVKFILNIKVTWPMRPLLLKKDSANDSCNLWVTFIWLGRVHWRNVLHNIVASIIVIYDLTSSVVSSYSWSVSYLLCLLIFNYTYPISMMLWATWCMYFGLILEIPWRFYSFLFFNNHSKTSLTSHIQVLKVHDVRIRPSDNFSCERDFICVGIKNSRVELLGTS